MQRNPTSLDYKKHNLDLVRAQGDLVNKSPNESEPFVDAVNDFSQINQKRKSGLQAGIEGFASGLKYGAKKGAAERRQRLFDFLEQNIMAMRERSDYLEKRKQFFEDTTPYVTALYDISNSKTLNDNDKQQYTANLMKQYQQVDPDSGKFDIVSAPAGQDFFVVVDRSTGDKSIRTYQSMMTPEAWNDLKKRNLEDLKMNIQQQNADAYGRSVQNSLDVRNDQIEAQKEAKALQSQQKQLKDLEAAYKEYEIYDSAEKLLYAKDDNGNIKFNKDGTPQLTDRALQSSYSQGIFDETPNMLKNEDQALFGTLTSDAKGRHFKQMGYRNETEYKNIRTIDPRLSAKANMEIIKSQKERLTPYIKQYHDIKNNLSSYNEPHIQQPQGGVPSSNVPQGGVQQGEGQIKVKSPGGKIGLVPINKLKTVLAQGGELLE